ncbi:hypothetical protein LPJ57_007284 [Coemansia sp. RSA 486]|nr:hypothetical protein LPJ57_007284 [Coemansia sp. RSA 486]KAJ2219986.1 hypothetical protein IWW45_009208 [Coemansia sp. RSA 485]
MCSISTISAKKSSDSGVEYVRACDSGSDDVTNMCINRIPEDIGKSSGNHACAYHEAEVKCLGLCGNTVTWKVAYNNSLKRYRLVCASYIDERLAEKEEEGDGGDSEEKPKKKEQEQVAEDSEQESPKKKTDEDGRKQTTKLQSKGNSSQNPSQSSSNGKNAKTIKPSATSSASPPRSGSSEPKSIRTVDPEDSASKDTKHRSRSGASAKSERSMKGEALLPTMDPELAGAASNGGHILAIAASSLFALLTLIK